MTGVIEKTIKGQQGNKLNVQFVGTGIDGTQNGFFSNTALSLHSPVEWAAVQVSGTTAIATAIDIVSSGIYVKSASGSALRVYGEVTGR